MPQQLESTISTARSGKAQHIAHRAHRVERLLVTVAVHQRVLLGRHERIEAAGAVLAGEEFLEQERALGETACVIAEAHHQELVAQGQEARWLEPDDGGTARDVRRERGDDAARFGLRLVDQSRREEGAAAAERPLRAASSTPARATCTR